MANVQNSPTLEVDLNALTHNYKLLRSKSRKNNCAAVVKANAYGLGVAGVAPALYESGCRTFFVATLEEAVELKKIFAAHRMKPEAVYVFHGVRKGQKNDFLAHDIIPVINDYGQFRYWHNSGPYALHVDTGMSRLGFNMEEIKDIEPTANLQLVLSHLACANEKNNPKNKEQLSLFKKVLAHFPRTPASLANSSGIFLGKDYHFDLLRPGCSLYGISPNTSLPNPMKNIVNLSAPVLQYRTAEKRQTVGYGASATVRKGTVLATVELGYADGFLRLLSNKAHGYVGDMRVPLIGRVSMDMLIFDVSEVPARLRTPDMRITLIGRQQPVDILAKAARTIGYEVFTRIGARVKRVYSEKNQA